MDTNGSQFLRLDQCYEDGWGGHEGLETQMGMDPAGPKRVTAVEVPLQRIFTAKVVESLLQR